MNKFTVNGELYRVVSTHRLKGYSKQVDTWTIDRDPLPDTLYLRDSDGTLHLPSSELFESRDLLTRPSELAVGDVVYDEYGLTYDIIDSEGETKAKIRHTNTSLPIWQVLLYKPQEGVVE